jgi:hypothetical protein
VNGLGLAYFIYHACACKPGNDLQLSTQARMSVHLLWIDPGSTAILANAPATLAEYSVSAVFCPISVQYRKPIKSRFTDADVSGYVAGIGEMQLSEI